MDEQWARSLTDAERTRGRGVVDRTTIEPKTRRFGPPA
jgi:hypothetical protein